MDLDKNIEEIEVVCYRAICPDCDREFGPDTEERVKSQLASHYYSQHS